MTYEDLLQRCRKTLDLAPDSKEGLRDIQAIIAKHYRYSGTAAALYSCLFSNLVEYIEHKRYEEIEHDEFGCPVAKTGIYAKRSYTREK